jgi:hypothetical protein
MSSISGKPILSSEIANSTLTHIREKSSSSSYSEESIALPDNLRGYLFQAAKSIRDLNEQSGEPMSPFSVGRIAFRSAATSDKTSYRAPLRTSSEVLSILTRDVRSANTLGEVHQAAQNLRPRLLSTGVFKNVEVRAADRSSKDSVDLMVDLDERTFSMSTGVTHSIAGSLRGGTQMSVMNVLGQAETISLSVGSAAGDLSFSGISDVFSPSSSSSLGSSGGDSLDGTSSLSPRVRSSAKVFEQLTTPTFSLSLRKPTFFDALTPLDIRVRSEVEFNNVQSAHSNVFREIDATLTDPSGRHSVGYSLSWRNLRPLRVANTLFSTASSPEVVANCDSSLKSSFNYSFNDDKMNDQRAPTAGRKTVFRAELAGAGGDVHFAKASFFGSFAASLLRFAPDTGYALPDTKREKLTPSQTRAQIDESLRPHPGAELLNVWGRAASGYVRRVDSPIVVTNGPIRRPATIGGGPILNQEASYSMLDRLAGWLSPGVTGILDLSLGGIIPFGASAKQSENTRTRLPDRFFLQGAKCRGFDSIGPRANKISGGSISGDALGGDVLASLSARILLPPPVPSINAANFGVRTQLFATAANLSSLSSPVRLNASAGVGLYVPVVAGAALEANYALWHSDDNNGMSPKATFRVQLSG